MSTKLTETGEMRLGEALRWVDSIAWRVYRGSPTSVEIDDIKAAGRQAALLSAMRFKPERGPFRPFAMKKLRWAMWDLVRATTHSRRKTPDGFCLEPIDHERHLGLLPRSTDPSDALMMKRQARAFQAALAELPSALHEVLQRHDLEGETFDEIATRLGTNKSWAVRARQRAIRRVRERLISLGMLGP